MSRPYCKPGGNINSRSKVHNMEINHLLRHRESARSYDDIVNDFIVRKDLFERAKYELETRHKGDSFNNFIYVGNRGSGKSTILERIRHEIIGNKKLNKRYITIEFADETRDIYKLFDLWSKIILQLSEQGYKIEEPLFTEYEDRMDEYSRESILRINALLEKENKILVLFIDNIDRLFKNIKSDKSQLREALLNYQNIRIFGGSTSMSESFWDYGETFYEFFTIVTLENLTKDEIYKLLSHWIKKQGKEELQKVIDDNPGKIEAIRIMTGGNPRMMISFMRMLLDTTLETGYDYLRMLIDDATMGYQEKLNNISGQKAKIFSELAYIYEAAQVDQLIQPCKMTSKTISAQLNALIKDNYVEKIKTDNKNHLYRVKERFFNIWIIMTQSSPLVRQKARYLTDFLELFYSKDDIQSFFLNWKNKVRSKELSADKAIIQAKALYHSKHISLNDEMEIYNTVSEIDQPYNSALHLFPKALKPIIDNAYELADEGQVEEAEKLLLDQINNEDKCKYIYGALGLIFSLYDSKKAENYFLEAIEKGDTLSLFNLALLYRNQGNFGKVVKYLLKAIEHNSYYKIVLALFYYGDIYKPHKATALIDEYVFEYPKDIEGQLFQNIIALSIGDSNTYLKNRNQIIAQLINISNEKLKIILMKHYLKNVLIHHQENWMLSLFEGEEYGKRLMQTQLVYYYATIMLIDEEDSRLKAMPPELEETTRGMVQKIKEGRKKYYG